MNQPKKDWGRFPNREKGGVSRSEKAYIVAARRVLIEGFNAAADPKLTVTDYPKWLKEDMRSYWVDGFKRGRKII